MLHPEIKYIICSYNGSLLASVFFIIGNIYSAAHKIISTSINNRLPPANHELTHRHNYEEKKQVKAGQYEDQGGDFRDSEGPKDLL